MHPALELFAYGVRQVVDSSLAEFAEQALEASSATGGVVLLIRKRLEDPSGTLPRALSRANGRAWQSVAVALAGRGLLTRVKEFFTGPTPQALLDQVEAFLARTGTTREGTPAQFRQVCLGELHQARSAGLLSADRVRAEEVAREAAAYRGLADPVGLVEESRRAVAAVAAAFPPEYPNLATFLREAPPEGQPPLLVAAFAYFFRREVETNEELARGLNFDALRQLTAGQESAFAEIKQFREEFRQWRDELHRLATRNHVRGGETSGRMVVSITSDQEQNLLRRLRDKLRELPPELRQADDLMLLADTLSAAGLFGLARDGHVEAAGSAAEEKQTAREAEGHFKAHRDACQQGPKGWADALRSLRKAAELDPARFEPFPLVRYEPERILGSGGFGTVFLCRDRYAQDREVAVKCLHTADLARPVAELFAEAQTLQDLKHDAIIAVRHWDFAGPDRARPYIVMEHFPGRSLQEHLVHHGVLSEADLVSVARQIAAAMLAAHGQNVLHRDLKPDNVLVLAGADGWRVKVIDFGLAVRQQAVATSLAQTAAQRTVEEQSFAGTYKYAPPEQRGELPGVPVGTHSDVYTFGKTCCEALFGTTEPLWDYEELPAEHQALYRLLQRCTAGPLKHRPPDFTPVVRVLETLESRNVPPVAPVPADPVVLKKESPPRRPPEPEYRGKGGKGERERTKQPPAAATESGQRITREWVGPAARWIVTGCLVLFVLRGCGLLAERPKPWQSGPEVPLTVVSLIVTGLLPLSLWFGYLHARARTPARLLKWGATGGFVLCFAWAVLWMGWDGPDGRGIRAMKLLAAGVFTVLPLFVWLYHLCERGDFRRIRGWLQPALRWSVTGFLASWLVLGVVSVSWGLVVSIAGHFGWLKFNKIDTYITTSMGLWVLGAAPLLALMLWLSRVTKRAGSLGISSLLTPPRQGIVTACLAIGVIIGFTLQAALYVDSIEFGSGEYSFRSYQQTPMEVFLPFLTIGFASPALLLSPWLTDLSGDASGFRRRVESALGRVVVAALPLWFFGASQGLALLFLHFGAHRSLSPAGHCVFRWVLPAIVALFLWCGYLRDRTRSPQGGGLVQPALRWMVALCVPAWLVLGVATLGAASHGTSHWDWDSTAECVLCQMLLFQPTALFTLLFVIMRANRHEPAVRTI